MDCAEWGIPIELVPVLLLGMISPTTTIGALVLHTAEVLSGLTIAQIVRPGTPVVFGGAPASFHMQLMTNPMTAVEALQVYCGYAQVAKHLKLPSQAYMALSDSKFNDPQAGMETGVGAFLAACAGINSVSGPGMLDYVNCFSFEKLVFDDEVVAHAKRFVRPVEVRDDLPAAELLAELVRDKHLLTSEHTLARWPEELYLPARWSTAPTGTSGRAGLAQLARARQPGDRRDARELRARAARRTTHTPRSARCSDDQPRGGVHASRAGGDGLMARLRAHEPAPLRGQARARQADDRGRARRGPPGDGGARGRPDRGMRVVGEDFKYNRVFVPEVLLAARAMKAGMAVLKPLLTDRRRTKPRGPPP